jgi:hypothetical protein
LYGEKVINIRSRNKWFWWNIHKSIVLRSRRIRRKTKVGKGWEGRFFSSIRKKKEEKGTEGAGF